jgi:hypothetical protein
MAGLPWLAFIIGQALSAQRRIQDQRAVILIAGGLACFNAEWAKILSERLGTSFRPARVHANFAAGWAYGGVVVALLLTPWLYDSFHPVLRLLNLTDSVLSISVDNRFLANVEPAQSENPRAGVLTNIVAGHHLLSARRHDGTLVEQLTADVLAGQTHLFAPARPKGICFWLERFAVGRDSEGKTARELLEGEQNFWVLETTVDVWFEPAPSSAGRFGTGGVVTSLRQGACSTVRNE